MNRKRLPKEIFVKWEGLDEEMPWMTVEESMRDHACKDGKVIVGTYRLVREDAVMLVTKISQRKVRP